MLSRSQAFAAAFSAKKALLNVNATVNAKRTFTFTSAMQVMGPADVCRRLVDDKVPPSSWLDFRVDPQVVVDVGLVVEHVLDGCRALSRPSSRVPSDYPLICKPFSEERAHETRRRVTPSHVSVFLLGYPPESAPDRHGASGGAHEAASSERGAVRRQ